MAQFGQILGINIYADCLLNLGKLFESGQQERAAAAGWLKDGTWTETLMGKVNGHFQRQFEGRLKISKFKTF